MRAEEWVNRWDAQQERYVPDREERFAVLCDVVETALTDVPKPVVLDLGCGPGSLAARLRKRLPHATIIGVDSDPLLLSLARGRYGDAIEWVDADLNSPDWHLEVPSTVHAAVSSTALHWLSEPALARVYGRLASLGVRVFVNADHLGHEDSHVDALLGAVRDRRAVRAGVLGNEEWRPWWDAILADPDFADLAQDRAGRKAQADSHQGNHLTVAGHSGLLRSVGFRSVAPVWQVGDDHVLVALR
jgi:SAM-dependent methyltransferase